MQLSRSRPRHPPKSARSGRDRMVTQEPPEEIVYSLAEADQLLWDLESARDALDELGALAALAGVEHQVIVLHRKMGFDQGGLR